MTLTLTINDSAAATRLLNAFCAATKWDAGSGITKAEWARQQIALYFKQIAKRGEYKASYDSIGTSIDAIVIS